jgi:hypothetical protein
LDTRAGKIHYVVGGNPDAPLMLFVHGFPEVFVNGKINLNRRGIPGEIN